MKTKICYYPQTDSYYRKTKTNRHEQLTKKMKRLNQSLNYAIRAENTQEIDAVRLEIEKVKRLRNKEVIFERMRTQDVPADAKVTLLYRQPDRYKYRVTDPRQI